MDLKVYCLSCGLELYAPETGAKTCLKCIRELGEMTLPPSRRGAKPCARCGHAFIIRSRARGMELMIAAATGVLETYVCRACGFTEWYTQSPENILIDAQAGSDLLEARTDPYR